MSIVFVEIIVVLEYIGYRGYISGSLFIAEEVFGYGG